MIVLANVKVTRLGLLRRRRGRSGAEVESQLFEEHKGEDGVRGQANEGGHVALEEAGHTRLLVQLGDDLGNAARFLLARVHHTCLENVQLFWDKCK